MEEKYLEKVAAQSMLVFHKLNHALKRVSYTFMRCNNLQLTFMNTSFANAGRPLSLRSPCNDIFSHFRESAHLSRRVSWFFFFAWLSQILMDLFRNIYATPVCQRIPRPLLPPPSDPFASVYPFLTFI